MILANKELKAGMEVCMFDVLNGFENAAALSDALKARVSKYYGTPLTAFLSALCMPGKNARLGDHPAPHA